MGGGVAARGRNEPGAGRAAVGMPSFAPIVDAVRPGVVGVHTIRPESRASDEAPPGSEGARDADGEGTSPTARRGWGGKVSGTGLVIDARGLIVTNEHIVADAREILVRIPGELRDHRADVVGLDPISDIAVLRLVDPPRDLTVLPLGDSSEVRQGDWVVTVGNPLGFSQSVTAGVVSFVGRHIFQDGSRVSNELLQFSAPINPGSSGGPVLGYARSGRRRDHQRDGNRTGHFVRRAEQDASLGDPAHGSRRRPRPP